MSHDDDRRAQVTRDAFLGGHLTIIQPRQGYRAGMDAVFLAAAVPVRAGDRVLDVGSGVGTAGLCVAWRTPECRVTLVEQDSRMMDLAQQNIQANSMGSRVHIQKTDIHKKLSILEPQSFHHVMSNPPYFDKNVWFASPQKTSSHSHVSTTLESWVAFCCRMARPYGTVTFVHRADHLGLLCHLVHGRLGDLALMPLWPRAGHNAHRVLLQGIKGSKGPMRLLPGVLLQDNQGAPTKEAEAVAREGRALLMMPSKGPSPLSAREKTHQEL